MSAAPDRRRPLPLILLLLFFFSGLASLVYEVTWLKLLAGSLSNSSHVLSIVLASFLLGLAIGARSCGKVVSEIDRPLRAYAWLEFAVAATALAVPFVLRFLAESAWSFLPAGVAHGARLVLCGVVILAVTIPMGATFPLQVAIFRPSPSQAVRASSFILSFQTAGGMTGVLLSGFVWLPALGIQNTQFLAVSLSGLVAAAAFLLSRHEAGAATDASLHEPDAPRLPAPQFTALCAVVGLVGGASLALEVLYTRILSFFLPDLAWSFSAVLAVYLLAIAVGVLLASRLARPLASLSGVGAVAVLGGALAIASLMVPGFLYGLMHSYESLTSGFTAGAFAVASVHASLLMVAPAAAVLAAFLPLGIGLLAPGRGTSPSAGTAFSTNSIGSACGALLAGLVIVPWVGLKGGVLALGVLVMGAGGLLIALDRPRRRPSRLQWILLGAALLLLVPCLWWAQPSRPLILDSAVFQRDRARLTGRELVEVREGSVTVASVVEEAGDRSLFTDAFQAAGTGASYRYMKMLGHLPMLLVPEPRRALVIAFGTGATAGSVSLHPALEHLTLVEISPEVLELAPYFEAVNFGLPARVPEGLALAVEIDDGRAFLRRTSAVYDVITLEPLLPGTPAAIHFYTRDFFALARERLARPGVLCHWIPLHAQSLTSLQSILHSFVEVFPASDVYLFGHSAVLLGWNGERPSQPVAELSRRFEAVYADLQRAELHTPEDVLGAFVTDGATLRDAVRAVPPVTDDRPRILYDAIRPNHESLRHHAEAVSFLLTRAREAPPDGVTGLSEVFRQRLHAAQGKALATQWQLAQRQELEYEARRLAIEQGLPPAAGVRSGTDEESEGADG